MIDNHTSPLSLYIHTPWCVKKCPYCDFNSHPLSSSFDESSYIDKLIAELEQYQSQMTQRKLHSIFIGGGTPSLISHKSYQKLFKRITEYSPIDNIEITLEANPGTVEQHYIDGYRQIGINRISLGAQSFNNEHLKALGRIHSRDEIIKAIAKARHAGFDNINIDLMYALPKQTPQQALEDLNTAIDMTPEHISWYQLTLEPNTLFAVKPPPIPDHDTQADIEQMGLAVLEKNGYCRYEVSAYAKGPCCQHNLNYWRYGDYIGIGAGAHGKISTKDGVKRSHNVRHPKQYLGQPLKNITTWRAITIDDLIFEFMLNHLRLIEPVQYSHFERVTGLNRATLLNILQDLEKQNLLKQSQHQFQLTPQGFQHLDTIVSHFLQSEL